MTYMDERRRLLNHRINALTTDQRAEYRTQLDRVLPQFTTEYAANGNLPMSAENVVMDWVLTQVELGTLSDQRDPLGLQQDIHAALVEAQIKVLAVRDEAKRKYEAAKLPAGDPPEQIMLADMLDEEDEDAQYRIDGLLPAGGNVILAAQYKAGKSTLIGNLIRSLVDGEPFLGRFPVQQVHPSDHLTVRGSVLLIDNELDPRTLKRWLRDQGIKNTDAVEVLSLRGQLSTFDIMDPESRAKWVRKLECYDVVILDCLRPLLDAFGLDENLEAGKFLVAWDEFKKQGWIKETIIVHHMGHAGERQRGSSRLLDWPDATWKIVREEPSDPASARYFSAFGRDVDVQEGRLEYDAATRHLHLAGGDRKAGRIDAAVEAVTAVLAQAPNMTLSRNSVVKELARPEKGGWPRRTVFEALDRLHASGGTVTYTGPRNAQMNTLKAQGTEPSQSPFASTGPTLPVSQTLPGKRESTFPPSPIRGEGGGPGRETTDPAKSGSCPLHGAEAKPDACYTCAQPTPPPFHAAPPALPGG